MLHVCVRHQISHHAIRLRVILISMVCCTFAAKECTGQDSLYSCGIIIAMLQNKFVSTLLNLDRSPDPTIRFLDRLQQLKECSLASAFGKTVVVSEGPFDSTFRPRRMDISITLRKSKSLILVDYQQVGTGQVGLISMKKKGGRFRIVKWRHTLY